MCLGCTKKSDITISLEIKNAMPKLLHSINISKHRYDQGSKCINLLQGYLPCSTKKNVRMQFLCVNPLKGKDHHLCMKDVKKNS